MLSDWRAIWLTFQFIVGRSGGDKEEDVRYGPRVPLNFGYLGLTVSSTTQPRDSEEDAHTLAVQRR